MGVIFIYGNSINVLKNANIIHLNDAIQRVKHPAPPSVPHPLEWKEKLIYVAISK